MFKYNSLFRSLIFYAFLGLLFTAGCTKEDDPITPQEEHFEAIGVYFTVSGIEVASILRGVTNDTLKAPLGTIGDGIKVQFYDEDENIVNPPADPDQTFFWEISDTTIVEVFQHPGEEGGYEFHLRGKVLGLTDIEFFILHEGHADFRSGKIPVVVEDN